MYYSQTFNVQFQRTTLIQNFAKQCRFTKRSTCIGTSCDLFLQNTVHVSSKRGRRQISGYLNQDAGRISLRVSLARKATPNTRTMTLARILLVCLAAYTSAETIPELATRLGATELVKLVTAAGLADTLSGPGEITYRNYLELL